MDSCKKIQELGKVVIQKEIMLSKLEDSKEKDELKLQRARNEFNKLQTEYRKLLVTEIEKAKGI